MLAFGEKQSRESYNISCSGKILWKRQTDSEILAAYSGFWDSPLPVSCAYIWDRQSLLGMQGSPGFSVNTEYINHVSILGCFNLWKPL